jgi:hypothetical protein
VDHDVPREERLANFVCEVCRQERDPGLRRQLLEPVAAQDEVSLPHHVAGVSETPHRFEDELGTLADALGVRVRDVRRRGEGIAQLEDRRVPLLLLRLMNDRGSPGQTASRVSFSATRGDFAPAISREEEGTALVRPADSFASGKEGAESQAREN